MGVPVHDIRIRANHYNCKSASRETPSMYAKNLCFCYIEKQGLRMMRYTQPCFSWKRRATTGSPFPIHKSINIITMSTRKRVVVSRAEATNIPSLHSPNIIH